MKTTNETDHETTVLAQCGEKGMHFQSIANCTLRKLEATGQLVMGSDLFVRTAELHARVFGVAK